jgi:hypothetical protein
VTEAVADTVDLAAERKAAGINDVIEALGTELVGLVPVKQRVAEIAALLLVDRVRERVGLASARPSLHMCFTGAPGTGKTTVALRMADLLHRVGYLERGHMVAVTRDDLVGQYVGHTAPKTKEVLKRAMGGVLFIDEAYYLYRADNERDYGQEAIEILLQVMENQRDKMVQPRHELADRAPPGLSRILARRASADRRADAARGTLPAVGRGRDDPAGVPQQAHAAAAVRERAQCPERDRAGPAAPREPPASHRGRGRRHRGELHR